MVVAGAKPASRTARAPFGRSGASALHSVGSGVLAPEMSDERGRI